MSDEFKEDILAAIEKLDEKNDTAHEKINGQIQSQTIGLATLVPRVDRVETDITKTNSRINGVEDNVIMANEKVNRATNAVDYMKGQWKVWTALFGMSLGAGLALIVRWAIG